MEEMEVKVDEEVRYEELTEKGRYLVDRVDSDWWEGRGGRG